MSQILLNKQKSGSASNSVTSPAVQSLPDPQMLLFKEMASQGGQNLNQATIQSLLSQYNNGQQPVEPKTDVNAQLELLLAS